ncbi:swarming motility protein SwrAA [Bacillus sp. CLL-7-23]|uniref:Swarming motility protein SwrAA n=1 Tax=Bacillus changyiensis TaxID=3004103 RepID=A0ABT4X1G5_9BACI|nr:MULTISPECIES: swarming motility protein SwrAA [Bacillus]MDA1476534.1 Swarming motility protein SwrAA [Bacillus changyiensis]MDA7025544.1 swarming motility protein SwrAA [Bacillus changyiensis]NPC94294.1 Swarming motility protein SwrAA [Bacillus sp. WMMC1349]
MKRASIVREKKYYELVEQLKVRSQDVTFSATKAVGLLMLFSRYLVNYTSVESVDDIDEECADLYFNYLMDNHKRLGINLTDIKRSMQLIGDILNVEMNHYLKDFSLSNVTLWMSQEK